MGWSGLMQWAETTDDSLRGGSTQQYGTVSEILVVVCTLHMALLVFGGDRCETPGASIRTPLELF